MGPTCCRLHTGDPSPHAIRCEYPRCYFQLRPFVWCFLQWSGSSVGWSLDLSRHVAAGEGRRAIERWFLLALRGGGFVRRTVLIFWRAGIGIYTFNYISVRRYIMLRNPLTVGGAGAIWRHFERLCRFECRTRILRRISFFIFFRGLDSTSHARFLSRPWRSQADASPNRTTEDPTFQFDR
jgi:hypothetical protein